MSYHPIECNFKQILRQRSSSATMRNMIQWNMVKLLRSWFSTCFNIFQYYCFKIIIIIIISIITIIIIKKVVGWLYSHICTISPIIIILIGNTHHQTDPGNWMIMRPIQMIIRHSRHRESLTTKAMKKEKQIQGISKFGDDIINPLVN